MKIIDFYPLKGFFKPDELVQFKIEVETDHDDMLPVSIRIYSGYEPKFSFTQVIQCKLNENTYVVDLPRNIDLLCGGYAISAEMNDQVIWTAFDVQENWLAFPRYGFVSEFSADLLREPGTIPQQMEQLAKYHITGLQFYDWQYRHDQLVAPQDEYLDPLQRPLSLKTIRLLIDTAHQYNLAAMPYLAIYGASIEFWRQHPDWGLYDEHGKPLLFEDFLGLMDPTQGTPWCAHLAEQCAQTLKALPFDGLHIDQYGDPKEAFTKNGEEINIPQAFVDFINAQKEALQVPVFFNAVGNWPIEALAKSNADVMYIEVWPPTPKFTDLQHIVENARSLSAEKPVIIPIYIPAAQKTNVLLADAVIAASGGTHLELGDELRLLSDPYFPKSEELSAEYLADLRRYWDFIVAYQDGIGPKTKNVTLPMQLPDGVHGIVRQNGDTLTLHLIQLSPEDLWTEAQTPRALMHDVPIRIELPETVQAAFWGTPDQADWQLKPLPVDQQNGDLQISLPALQHWSLVKLRLN